MGRSPCKGKSSGFFANLFRGLFSGDSPVRTDSGARKCKGVSHRRLRFEGCEDRRMLSIDVGWGGALPAGVLNFSSDAGSDSVAVVGRATYVDVFVNNNFNSRIQTANATNVTEIRFSGGGGADSLTVQGIQLTGTLAIGSAGNAISGVENLSVVNGNNVTVNNGANALNFGTSKLNGTLGVTSAGALTQTGALSVTGATTLTVTAGDITLDNAANNFNSTVAVTATAAGQDLSLTDVNGIVLGNVDIGGNLTIVANNNSTRRVAISQSGATTLTVDGNTSLTAGSSSTITLGNANLFGDADGDTLSATAANATLRDAKLFDTTLAASTVTGNLTVTSADDILDSGDLVVGKVATFTVPAGFDVTLDSANNNFGTVAATATGAGASVTINDMNALVLGAIDAADLTVTADGAITQKAAVTITGTATLAAGSQNDITLTKSTNNFNIVRIVSGEDVNLRDSGAVVLTPAALDSTVSGNLTVTAGGAVTQDTGNLLVTAGKTTLKAAGVTLSNAANNFNELAVTSTAAVDVRDADALILAKSRLSSALQVEVGGELSQSGALAVKSNTATLIAGAGNDITLDNAGNDFRTVVVSSGNNVLLRDLNAIILGASAVSGDLSVQANLNSSSRLAISQSGALAVTGSTTLEVGARSSITLTNAANELHGAGGSVAVIAGANATLTDASAINLGDSTLSGNLTVNGGGAATDHITQGGPLVVGKVATLVAGAADVVLDDADNDFGTLAVTSGDIVSVSDKSALILGASNVGGTLGVTTDGAITQSGVLAITGAATLSAGEANDIVLLNAANDFSSIGIESGRNVALRDGDAIDLAASTVSGTLDVKAEGITDSGALDIAGKTTLTAGAANDVALDELTNNLGEVAVTSALDVTLVNGDALILAASTISGNLDVTLGAGATGGLSQSGALTVAGTATLDTGANDVELTNAANNFATVALTAENATLRDINAMDLGASTLGSGLTVTAGGAITDSGALDVGGLTTLTTSALANIELDTAANLFTDAVSVTSANNVAISATAGLILGASSISGTLGVTLAGAGDLTQSGAVAVAGTTTLAVSAANNVDLTNAANNFAAVGVTSALDVSLADADDVVLGDATVAGALSVTANGSITDGGVVAVTLTTTLAADADGDSAGDIALDSLSSFADTLSVTGGVNVEIHNNIATKLGDIFATGDFTMTGNADLTNDLGGAVYGILSVVGDATIDIGSNDMSLRQTGWTYGSLSLVFGTLTNL